MKKSCTFLLLLLLAAGCSQKREKAGQEKKATASNRGDVVAVVGSEAVTIKEFNAEFSSIRKEYPKRLTPALSLKLSKIKKEFLDNLITERFLRQIAQSRGVVLSSAEKALAVQRAIGHGLKEARKLVEAQGINFSVWLERVTEKAVAEKLIEQEVYKKISVSLGEARRYFSNNPSLFVQREKVHLLQVVMETEAEALDALRKLRRGRSFKKMAGLPSVITEDGQSSDMGYVELEKLPEKLKKAAFALKKGEVSDVISMEYGFHILKCVDRKERRQMSFKEAYPLVKSRLNKQKRVKAYSEWVAKNRKNIKIVVNPDLLKTKENITYKAKAKEVSL